MDYNGWYTEKRLWLCHHTPFMQEFMSQLRSKSLLSPDKQAEIESHPGPVKRCEVLYDHLVQFCPWKIGDIIYCLEESQQQHVADAFREISVSTVTESTTMTQNSAGPLQLDHDALVRYRGLIVADDEALQMWPTIAEQVVKSAADRLEIRSMINRDRDYHGAVLKTLRLWAGYGNGRPDLLHILREEGFGELADKIRGN